jgi:hypothetical protein
MKTRAKEREEREESKEEAVGVGAVRRHESKERDTRDEESSDLFSYGSSSSSSSEGSTSTRASKPSVKRSREKEKTDPNTRAKTPKKLRNEIKEEGAVKCQVLFEAFDCSFVRPLTVRGKTKTGALDSVFVNFCELLGKNEFVPSDTIGVVTAFIKIYGRGPVVFMVAPSGQAAYFGEVTPVRDFFALELQKVKYVTRRNNIVTKLNEVIASDAFKIAAGLKTPPAFLPSLDSRIPSLSSRFNNPTLFSRYSWVGDINMPKMKKLALANEALKRLNEEWETYRSKITAAHDNKDSIRHMDQIIKEIDYLSYVKEACSSHASKSSLLTPGN